MSELTRSGYTPCAVHGTYYVAGCAGCQQYSRERGNAPRGSGCVDCGALTRGKRCLACHTAHRGDRYRELQCPDHGTRQSAGCEPCQRYARAKQKRGACADCGKQVDQRSTRCRDCYGRSIRRDDACAQHGARRVAGCEGCRSARNAYMREYQQRPEVKAYRAEYMSRPGKRAAAAAARRRYNDRKLQAAQ